MITLSEIQSAIKECGVNDPFAKSDTVTIDAYYVQRVSSTSPHYLGGPTKHTGSNCSECGREATLIWDLDLTAHDIPDTKENFTVHFEGCPCTYARNAAYCLIRWYRTIESIVFHTDDSIGWRTMIHLTSKFELRSFGNRYGYIPCHAQLIDFG